MDSNNSKTKTEDKKKESKEDPLEKKADEEVEALKATVEEVDNKYKRALADYQNLEKRVREERGEWIVKANRDLLLHLLPILDTLMLVAKHIKVEDQGLTLSISQFLDILKAEGVEKIETIGKKFDPSIMQCVETVSGEEGKVLEDVRSGYSLNGNVLRPALVKVGK